MAEKKENMGAVTQQVSNYEDDMHKSAHIKETNVASVALGELPHTMLLALNNILMHLSFRP
jgi:hypothetical protein